MPQIQTIEGLFGFGQVPPQTQNFQMATWVSKDAYIATVERILKAAEESPDHKVTVPAFPRPESSASSPDERRTPCTVQGEVLVCRMTQMTLSQVVAAFREGPDPEYLDPARLREPTQAQFDQDNQVKAIFPILVSIEQQLPMSKAVWWALGLGAVAVLGVGWYMTSRKGSLGSYPNAYPTNFDRRWKYDNMGDEYPHFLRPDAGETDYSKGKRGPSRRCVKYETLPDGTRKCVRMKRLRGNRGKNATNVRRGYMTSRKDSLGSYPSRQCVKYETLSDGTRKCVRFKKTGRTSRQCVKYETLSDGTRRCVRFKKTGNWGVPGRRIAW